MATGRQKANMWHGRENVVACGRLPSPAHWTIQFSQFTTKCLANATKIPQNF